MGVDGDDLLTRNCMYLVHVFLTYVYTEFQLRGFASSTKANGVSHSPFLGQALGVTSSYLHVRSEYVMIGTAQGVHHSLLEQGTTHTP